MSRCRSRRLPYPYRHGNSQYYILTGVPIWHTVNTVIFLAVVFRKISTCFRIVSPRSCMSTVNFRLCFSLTSREVELLKHRQRKKSRRPPLVKLEQTQPPSLTPFPTPHVLAPQRQAKTPLQKEYNFIGQQNRPTFIYWEYKFRSTYY